MITLLLIMLVLLSSAPAYAEWMTVGGDEEAGVTVYADPDAIRRTGSLVKAWHLNDFKSEQIVEGISYLSIEAQHQYDCTTNRERILALAKFSGNMGRGKVVYKDSQTRKWKPIAPGSVSHELRKIACTK